MSVIRKVPYIETLLGKLSSTDLATLKSVVNSSTGFALKSYINNDYAFGSFTKANPDIAGYTIEFKENDRVNAIVIRCYENNSSTNTIQVALCYSPYSQQIEIYNIDPTKSVYTKVNEECSIEEIRRILSEKGDSQESAWELAIKEYLVQNGDTTEVGADMEIEGDLQLNSGISAIKDEDGNSIIADLTDVDSGKVLTANGSGGAAWVYPSATNISSGSATSGQVLTANGSGSATWSAVAGVDYKNTSGVSQGTLKFVKCTSSEYSAITPDTNTFYIIVG